MAVALTVIGIYIVGPWYEGGSQTTIGVVFHDHLTRAFPSIFYTVSGGYTLAGLFSRRFNRKFKGVYVGTFLMVLAYSYMLFLRLLTFGLTPIIWVLILLPALVSGVLFLWQSGRDE